MERMIHNLVQGSPEWDAFRLEHFGASEAAAMLGLTKKTSRGELLRMKHTGVAKEFSEWFQENVLDKGHRNEAAARPIVESMIGEDLFPATYSYGKLSASCDGLTMDGEIAFEHKQYNAELALAIRDGHLPDEYQPQCQQVMHVTGAKRVIFVCSDGTTDNFERIEVLPDPAWVSRIEAGWKQFAEDLANYQHVEPAAAVVAAPVKDLPAIVLTVSGQLSIQTNFDIWGVELREFISRIPEKPATDQEFADCKAAIAAFKKAEEQLDAEESRVLSMVPDIDEMKRQKKLLRDLSSTTRLALEKLVTRRDQEVKGEIVKAGRDALATHIENLNKRLGRALMPAIEADFPGAIKGKRNLQSMRDAVDALTANKKIEASEIADRIDANLKTIEAEKDHAFLFSDVAALAMKQPDDLALLIRTRIADHKAAEDRRLSAERERIAAEERARAQRDAEETLRREREAADAQARAAQVAQPAPVVRSQAPTHAGVTGTARLLDRLDDLVRQMTESELSDLCIHAAHILAARKQAA